MLVFTVLIPTTRVKHSLGLCVGKPAQALAVCLSVAYMFIDLSGYASHVFGAYNATGLCKDSFEVTCLQANPSPLPCAIKKVSLEVRSSVGQGGTSLWCG